MSADLVVGVATFLRPEPLARLLEGLADQRPLRAPGARVVVVDNDAAGSARPVVEACNSLPIDYVLEPQPGISAARNRVLDEATSHGADWIAFIDDDEVPETGWLEQLLEIQRRYDADVVAGPVISRFEKAPPDWIVRGRFFERPRRPTGTLLSKAFTGNVLFRYRLAKELGVRFPAALGLFGGGDKYFFERLHRAGARMVWADEAVVVETVPLGRMNAEWIVRRQHRFGTSAAWIGLDRDPGLRTHAWHLGYGVASMALGGLLSLLAPIGRHHQVEARCRFAFGLGLCQGTLSGHLEPSYAR